VGTGKESQAKQKQNEDPDIETKVLNIEAEDVTEMKLKGGVEVKEDLETELPAAHEPISVEDSQTEAAKTSLENISHDSNNDIEVEKASRTSDEFEVISDSEAGRAQEVKAEPVSVDDEKENTFTEELKVESPRSSSPTKSPNVRRRNKKGKHSK